ncbi:sugar transporter, putative [Plasmodium chabaudi adami]|uniref:Sugar transporter, putative n=1 Tax=Plasmodium chabaudi adami TaxID=5826 RepID=A0A1D3RTT9_PLACE|nr:sugar transporter, putative [Plasmodium chabaudi adami]
MMYLTKLVSNACLAIINCGLCLSLTSLSRKMLIKGYDICPEEYRGCEKEKWYFTTFYFTLYMSAFLGCFISLFFRNVNRKKFMEVIHFLFIIGSLFTIYYEPHVILFLFSQAFFGLAIGCSIVIVCFYIFEYSPKANQNYYGFAIQPFFSLGLLISYIFGFVYEQIDFTKLTSSYWVLMILQKLHMLVPLILSTISVLLLRYVFTMDTPLHLYKSQDYDKFEEIKKKISKKELDPKREYHLNEKTNEINIILNDLTLIDIFNDKKLRKKCIIGSILCYLFCFSGSIIFFNNLFIHYDVFKTKKESATISMIFMFIYFLFTIITRRLSRHYDKNKLIVFGFIFQTISSFIMMICSFCNLSDVLNKLIISISIILFTSGFSLGFGHIIWTHIFHIFSIEHKVVGAFCSYYAIFIGSFIMCTLLEFSDLNKYSYLFIVFIIFTITSIIFFKTIYIDNAEPKKKPEPIPEPHDELNISDTIEPATVEETEV